MILPSGTFGEEVGLNQNLYVDRTVESKLLYELAKSEHASKILLIDGEAGCGKTSLLWHLYTVLSTQAAWDPWFMKSSALLNHDISQHPGQGS